MSGDKVTSCKKRFRFGGPTYYYYLKSTIYDVTLEDGSEAFCLGKEWMRVSDGEDIVQEYLAMPPEEWALCSDAEDQTPVNVVEQVHFGCPGSMMGYYDYEYGRSKNSAGSIPEEVEQIGDTECGEIAFNPSEIPKCLLQPPDRGDEGATCNVDLGATCSTEWECPY